MVLVHNVIPQCLDTQHALLNVLQRFKQLLHQSARVPSSRRIIQPSMHKNVKVCIHFFFPFPLTVPRALYLYDRSCALSVEWATRRGTDQGDYGHKTTLKTPITRLTWPAQAAGCECASTVSKVSAGCFDKNDNPNRYVLHSINEG